MWRRYLGTGGLDETRERHLQELLGLGQEVEITSDLATQLLETLMAAYDSEIAYVDTKLREAFDLLGVDSSTAVIVTSDHGEEFLDHGAFGHGQGLYTELIHVPLIARLPGADAPRGRVAAHVSTLDILPTLRSYLGAGPGPQDEGADLLRAGTGEGARTVFSMLFEADAGDGWDGTYEREAFAVVRGPHKAIFGRPSGQRELYDLTADRGEAADLAGARGELISELEAAFDALRGRARTWDREFERLGGLDDAVLEHMRALGYAGHE